MTLTRRIVALLPAALLVLGLGTAAAVTTAPEAAHAQANFRVCGVYNSAKHAEAIGSGIVTKVYKGDDGSTCARKIQIMKEKYQQVWYGSSGERQFGMTTCEDFRIRIGAYPMLDPCLVMDTNGFYQFTSRYDSLHPVNQPHFLKWTPR